MPPKKTNYRRKITRSLMHPATQRKIVSGAKAAYKGYKTYQNVKKRYTKRPKTTSLSGPFSELSIQKYSGGRTTKKNLKGAWKVIKANTQSNVYAYVNIQRYLSNPGTPGQLGIASTFLSNTAAGTNKLPLHLYSLSAVPNVINGTVTNPTAMWALQKSDVTTAAYPSFVTVGNVTAQNVSGTSTAFNSYPQQEDIMKAINAKFILYGTLTRPCKYLIQIVQLRKPYLHPDYINGVATNNSNPASVTEMQKASAFYEELSKPFSFSPIAFVDNNQTKDLKVIKSWTHIIQPRTTLEQQVGTAESTSNVETTGTMPHSKIFSIYHKFNRTSKYNWNDSTVANMPSQAVGTSDNQALIFGQNQTDVTYNARMYLMIRALSPVFTYSGAFDAGVQPSYDVGIRYYHENQG